MWKKNPSMVVGPRDLKRTGEVILYVHFKNYSHLCFFGTQKENSKWSNMNYHILGSSHTADNIRASTISPLIVIIYFK